MGSTHVWGCPHWEALGDNRKASLTGLKAQFSCLCEDCAFIVSPQDGASSYEGVSGTIYSYYLLIAPIDGYYTPLNDIAATGRFVSSSKTENFVVPYSGSEVFYSAGQRVEDIARSFSLYGTGYGSGKAHFRPVPLEAVQQLFPEGASPKGLARLVIVTQSIPAAAADPCRCRSEEHTSELQSQR